MENSEIEGPNAQRASTGFARRFRRVAGALAPSREAIAVVISLCSLLVAGLSYRVAQNNLTIMANREKMALEEEGRRESIFLSGKVADNSGGIDLIVSDPDAIIQYRFIRLEYSKNAHKIILTGNDSRLDMEYLKPYLQRRLEYYRRSTIKDQKNLIAGGKMVMTDYMPLLVEVGYIKNGKILRHVGFYGLTYEATWYKGSPKSTFRLTGLTYCTAPRKNPDDWWHSDKFDFVDPRFPGGIPGPRDIVFVFCADAVGFRDR